MKKKIIIGIDINIPKKDIAEYSSLKPSMFFVSKNIDCLTRAVSEPKQATLNSIKNKLKA